MSNACIARVLRGSGADVVGLNEVWRIPRLFEQPRLIAKAAGMNWEFEETTRYLVQSLGNAAMTRGEIVGRRDIALPRAIEKRGALLLDLDVDGSRIAFVSTHLSLGRKKRAMQIATLAAQLPRDRPLVLAGDFNCTAEELEPLREFLTVPDAPPCTYPAIRPSRSLDHIAFSAHWRLSAEEAVRSLASDHLALWADLELV